MDEQIIVLVSDREDSKHGEISVMDDPQKAERLVETLLEAGFDKQRIRVYVGRVSEFQISHRPVVALGVAAGGGEPEQRAKPESPDRDSRDEAPQQPPRAAASAETEDVAVKASAPAATVAASTEAAPESGGQEGPAPEAAEVEEAPADEAAEPVKFSSLFRSA